MWDSKSKQRECIKKEDAAMPNGMSGHYLYHRSDRGHRELRWAIIDLPSAFLHADLEVDDHVLMVTEGRLDELMVIAEPKKSFKFVAKDNNGKKVLHVKLQMALYG